MNILKKSILASCTLLSCGLVASQAQSNVMEIQILQPKKEIAIQPNMWGIFFEDINFAADGGLYAEMVKNRSFEFINSPLMGWIVYGPNEIRTEQPCFDRNPHYIRLSNQGLRSGTGLVNEGFRGMGVVKDETYRVVFYARTVETPEMKVQFELMNSDGNNGGRVEIMVNSSNWTKYEAILTASRTDEKARLRVNTRNLGTIDVDHISMFPSKTWKNRENGLRLDLAQALADLSPKVFRFPGGCIIEGNTLETRYNWKNSVGPVENRPINENRWNYTFQHRFTPDYFQTYGLGFFEFFQFCEDIGADALPVVSCGLACQYESKEKVAFEDLNCYVQDALDLIEFANGPVTSTWGKVRADMGHPEAFNLKMIGIGNEQWGEDFPKYLNEFIVAIRAKYPEIKIVGSSGPQSDGKDFDYLWPEMKRLKVDLVDEHYYRDPNWFLSNARRYDNYDRKGPKVFAGEYACHDGRDKHNTFYSALCEAAFMTGLERNADVVHLATYAPLFAHIDAWQWRPDMIWYDNLRSVKSANYYVQQLYSTHAGTHVWDAISNGKTLAGEEGIYASVVRDSKSNQIILKVANTQKEKKAVKINLSSIKASISNQATHILFKSELGNENTLENPNLAVPVQQQIEIANKVLATEINSESFNIYILNMN